MVKEQEGELVSRALIRFEPAALARALGVPEGVEIKELMVGNFYQGGRGVLFLSLEGLGPLHPPHAAVRMFDPVERGGKIDWQATVAPDEGDS